LDVTSHFSHSLGERSCARAFLGSDHPLTRVHDRLAQLARQLLVVGALVAVAIAATLASLPQARPYALVAAVAQAVLAVRAALLGQRRKQLALDLIIEGRGDLPLAAVARQQRRLLDWRTRSRLAAGCESLLEEALLGPKRLVPGPPVVAIAVVAAVAKELNDIIGPLRADDASARGIAFAERLLRDGGSSLYGRDVAALRADLGRARYLLLS
jgi:hypothetical protein